MLGRIIEIEGEGRRLTLERGFLAVTGPEGLLGMAPLDDIEAVILSNPASSLTSQVISALAQRGAPLVICGNDFRPSAYLLPVDGHYAQGERIEAQAAASLPTRKRLWAEIVRAKIKAQAAALERFGQDPRPVLALATRVLSGDPANVEAQASQRYFPALFGRNFTRRRETDGINAQLNYGYTILRAATARAIVGAGLHPSLSLQHRSRGEALRLADDMMEPFRPSVDVIVKDLSLSGVDDMRAVAKRSLAEVLHADFKTDDGVSILSNALARCAASLAQVFTGERKGLALPREPLPLSAQEAGEDED